MRTSIDPISYKNPHFFKVEIEFVPLIFINPPKPDENGIGNPTNSWANEIGDMRFGS